MEIAIEAIREPVEPEVEIVERKGLGHPDTICDALAENLSLALSRFYLERFGAILHHNVDKGLLCGGAARPAFGGGEVTEPIEIYLAGRATLGAQLAAQQLQTNAEAERFRLADLRYRSGVASYLEVLDAQRSLFIIQQALAQTRLAYLQNQVTLYKALGGGAMPPAP